MSVMFTAKNGNDPMGPNMGHAGNLREQLAKQLRFLAASCREYDAGNLDEAIRIAQAMRVMFHHTPHSLSLLTQLSATSTPLLSTNRRTRTDKPNGFWPGLVKIDLNVETISVSCQPIMGAVPPGAHRIVLFPAWWDSEVVFFSAGRRYRRKKLVLDAANKDGGAHVDPNLPPDYEWLKEGSGFAFSRESPDGERVESRPDSLHLACLRQMAFEVFNSPELLKLADWQQEEVAKRGLTRDPE